MSQVEILQEIVFPNLKTSMESSLYYTVRPSNLSGNVLFDHSEGGDKRKASESGTASGLAEKSGSGLAEKSGPESIRNEKTGPDHEFSEYGRRALANSFPPSILEFRSYMNAFSIDKWKKYCGINQVSLCLKGHGRCRLEMKLQSGGDQFHCLAVYNAELNMEDGYRTPVIDVSGLTGLLYFEVFVDVSELMLEEEYSNFYLKEGWYWTPQPAKREVNLSIVVTTFKRESYIRNLLAMFRREGLRNVAGTGTVKLRIVDNGQTLTGPEWAGGDGVEIFPNPNTGGAGGFTRGMMESMRDPATTHMLLMDDDVDVPPESIKRAMRVVRHAVDPDLYIGGAMLDFDYRWRMHEQGARVMRRRFRALKTNLDLRKPELVWASLEEELVDYYGWWFFMLSRNACEKVGWALPIFFRGDDMNYMRRMKSLGFKTAMDLNGICVWHEDFIYKENPVQMYYDIRNQFFINPAFRDRPPNPISMAITFWRYIMPIIRGHRYLRGEYVLRGVRDFFRGPEFLMTTDSGALHKELLSRREENIALIPPTDFDAYRCDVSMTMGVSRRTHLLCRLTWYGLLVPSFLRRGRKDGILDRGVVYQPLRGHEHVLERNLRARRIIYVERRTHKGFSVTVDSARGIRLLLGTLLAVFRILVSHAGMVKRYRKAAATLYAEESWKHHLFGANGEGQKTSETNSKTV